MLKPISTIVMTLIAGVALAQESAIGDDTAKAADQGKDKADTATAAEAKDKEEVVLPPGFKTKKRGDITLYCIRGKATGTRFETESCYDESQLRDYLLAREQNNRDFERSRAVCSSASVCAPQ